MSTVTLLYKLTADGSSFAREFQYAERDVQRFNRRAESSFVKFGKVAGVAAGVAATAMAAAFNETVKFAGEIDYLSDRTGIANEDLSRLAYAADQSDVSFGTFERRIQRFNQELRGAADGTGSTAAMMRSLGIATHNAEGALRPTTDVLMDVADAVAATDDSYKQAAIAAEFFGQRGGPQMLPLLQSGSEGIREMGDEAEALGLIIDDRTGAAARQFGDDMTRLTGLIKGAAISIGSQMLPAVGAYVDAMTKSAKENAKNNRQLLNVSKVTAFVVKAVEGVRVSFELLGETLGVVVGLIFDTVMGAWNHIKAFGGGIRNVFNAIKDRDMEALKSSFTGVGASMSAINKRTLAGMKAGWEGYKNDAVDIMQESANRMAAIDEAATKEIEDSHEEAAFEVKETWTTTVDEIGKRQQELVRQTDRWLEQLKGPAEKFGEEMAVLWESVEMGLITDEEFDRIEQHLIALRDPFGELADEAERLKEEEYFAGLVNEAEKLKAAYEGIDLAAQAHLESLEELHAEGLITWEQYAWAVQQAAGEIEQATDTVSDLERLGAASLESLGSHLVDFVVDPFNQSIEEMLESFLKAMARMAMEATMQLALNAALGGLGGGLVPVPGFASGGYVSGPGTSTSDSIPALLSDGEYVVNAAMTRKIGRQALDDMNFRGKLPKFARGGPVGRVQQGGQGGGGTKVVVVADMESAMMEALRSPAGTDVIIAQVQSAIGELEGRS